MSPKKVLLFMDYLQEKRHRDVTWWFENFVCQSSAISHWAHTTLVWGWAISFPRGPHGAVTCADKGLMCLNVAVLLTFIQRKACIWAGLFFFKPKTRQTYICILNILFLTYCFKLILDKDYIENDISKSGRNRLSRNSRFKKEEKWKMKL